MERLQACRGDALDLVPISSQPLNEQQRLLSQLHMETAEGTWVTGLEANVRAWQHTRFAKPVSILLLPGIRWFAEWGYALWLRWYQFRADRRSK